VFHRFEQIKFAYGGSILLLAIRPIYTAVPAASKNDDRFKSGQN